MIIINDNQFLITANEETIMWTKPNFEEIRLGFEVTLYISNR